MTTMARCFIEPKSSYFLFGSLGTGKSTYLDPRHTETCIWLNLLDSIRESHFNARSERLRDLIAAHPDRSRAGTDLLGGRAVGRGRRIFSC